MMEKRMIEVVDYDPLWQKRYQELKEELLNTLPNQIINLFHIGSTSIIGMSAKATIDILLEVKDINLLDSYQTKMKAIGYISHGEYGIEGRRYYTKQDGVVHLVHLHCFQYGNEAIADHLLFKQYLSEDQEMFEVYKNLKIKNASLYKHNPEDYQNAKHDVIQLINQKAKEKYSFIPKMRKSKSIISYQDCLKVIDNQNFGTLTITNSFPYSIPMNYVYDHHTVYFHTAREGYKLNGINQVACFSIVEDLGLKPEKRSHSFRSIMMYGTLYEEKEKREYILHKLLDTYAPEDRLPRDCIVNPHTMVLGLTIDYMIGRSHIR